MSKRKNDPKQLLLFEPFEPKGHNHGLGFAGRWLKMLADPNDELGQWLKVRRERHGDNQLVYIDRVYECYKTVFKHLPPQAGQVLWNLCRYYRKGCTLAHLAYICMLKSPAVSAQLHRMVDAGIVKRLERGKYAPADIDLLRYYAVANDIRRLRTFEETYTGDPNEILDKFMDYVENLPAKVAI